MDELCNMSELNTLKIQIETALNAIEDGDAAVDCSKLDAMLPSVCEDLTKAAHWLDGARKTVISVCIEEHIETRRVEEHIETRPKTLHHLDVGTLFLHRDGSGLNLWVVMDGGDSDDIHAQRVARLNVNNTGELMLIRGQLSVENFNAYNEVTLGSNGIYRVI